MVPHAIPWKLIATATIAVMLVGLGAVGSAAAKGPPEHAQANGGSKGGKGGGSATPPAPTASSAYAPYASYSNIFGACTRAGLDGSCPAPSATVDTSTGAFSFDNVAVNQGASWVQLNMYGFSSIAGAPKTVTYTATWRFEPGSYQAIDPVGHWARAELRGLLQVEPPGCKQMSCITRVLPEFSELEGSTPAQAARWDAPDTLTVSVTISDAAGLATGTYRLWAMMHSDVVAGPTVQGNPLPCGASPVDCVAQAHIAGTLESVTATVG